MKDVFDLSDVLTEEDLPEEENAGETRIDILPEEAGNRADAVLAARTGLSRSAIQRHMEEGQLVRLVQGNPHPVTKKDKTAAGEVYVLTLPPPAAYDVAPEPVPLDIVYEDDQIIVLNKPQGMVVHPAPGHTGGTLVNGLLYHCGDSLSGIGGVQRPGIVHRIDRDTSGLLCVAKTDMAHTHLSAQLSDHSMHREYRTIVIGGLPEETGTVDAPIGRHPTDRKKMAVFAKNQPGTSRHAVSHYRVLEHLTGHTYTEVILETGRTHQIRVHMAHIGHPVLGDPVYGGGNTPFVRRNPALFHGQMLHAAALVLTHPATGEKMRFTCPLPDYFEAALAKLRE
ncbi:MAG: RluA family pseudouridine synthase [Ruminococcaceae bacterium]|nr:RluA family pseudouridine synthase [Oscillospiraceae bacterium]